MSHEDEVLERAPEFRRARDEAVSEFEAGTVRRLSNIVQDRPPNFREDGRLYLVRCFVCGDTPSGRENWAMAVASGTCAWCGWNEAAAVSRAAQADPEEPHADQ